MLLGLGIGKITSIMGSGLDTTTHNRRDRERQAREESGLSRREMKELQRIVRKDPDRLKGLPDAEIAAQVRASLKRRQQSFVWILLGLLVILIVYALVRK